MTLVIAVWLYHDVCDGLIMNISPSEIYFLYYSNSDIITSTYLFVFFLQFCEFHFDFNYACKSVYFLCV